MKKCTTYLLTLFVGLTLMISPAGVSADVGAVGAGVDANGVNYLGWWIEGTDTTTATATYSAGYNWYEAYYDGTNQWGSVTGVAAYTDPSVYTTDGDFYHWAYIYDSAGNLIVDSDYDFDNIAWSNMQYVGATGLSQLDYYYQDLSGAAGAYYKSEDSYYDPLTTGTWYSLDYQVDKDGDGIYWGTGDVEYNEWRGYDPGTGDRGSGYYLRDGVNGLEQYVSNNSNDLTGSYSIYQEYYWDYELNGTYNDDYYTLYEEEYDNYDGSYTKREETYDYTASEYAAATRTYDYSYENLLTGDFYEQNQAWGDLDGDGDWNDYNYLGADPGAYYINQNQGLDAYEGYSSNYSQRYNVAAANAYEYSNSYNYLNTGYTYTATNYYYDYDQDGSYTDDFYSYGRAYTNDYGADDSYFYYYDYVGLISGKAAYYREDSESNALTGYNYQETDSRYDTDGDGDWNDYSSSGAYRYYFEEGYEPYGHEYYMQEETWTPAAADNSYGLSYEETYEYRYGDYWEQGYTRAVDADADNNVYDYWGSDFGGAYYHSTYSEYDPDEYAYYESYMYDVDPWNNYQFYSYSETYLDPLNASQPFYSYAYTDTYVDTDNDDDIYNNYYAYTETGNDQSSGDGYQWSENDWTNYDTGERMYSDSYSYATGSYSNDYQYWADIDLDGSFESFDDYYVNQESYYDADNGETYTYYWQSRDRGNVLGQYGYVESESESYLTGSYDSYTESANLVGYMETWSYYDADDGYSESGSETAEWGAYRTDTGSYAYDAGDNGTWYDVSVDTDNNTAWNNQYDYETYYDSWNDNEGSWNRAGYSLYDSVNGDSSRYEKGTSAFYDYVETSSYVSASGLESEINQYFLPGGTTLTAGKAEWWNRVNPGSYELFLYTEDAGDWYRYYYQL